MCGVDATVLVLGGEVGGARKWRGRGILQKLQRCAAKGLMINYRAQRIGVIWSEVGSKFGESR